MTRWEYRYVDLYRGENKPIAAACFEVTSELDRAGAEGWEIVGEINIMSVPPSRVVTAPFSNRVVVLKRPLN